ncbi:TPA: hypothetical protein ACFRG8_001259 [Neisseria lactamica]|uniref:hypothetical protein n=1 Tax=Neisseria lactamica TaxID=486 RepID=UPI001145A9B9|nr:hypothetical protein [Neisseria lactamica]
MQFPIYNIDVSSLGNNYCLLNEIIRYDGIYISDDEEIWRNLFLHMRFIDGKGDVYKLIDKRRIRKLWDFIFRIVRYECHFVATGERLSIEELRQVMEKQVRNTHEKYSQELIEGLQKAKTLTELILWETVDMKFTHSS